jgi:chromatin segregation and condensation protein Rec8/ScpA/Scc1 (kleisin family)
LAKKKTTEKTDTVIQEDTQQVTEKKEKPKAKKIQKDDKQSELLVDSETVPQDVTQKKTKNTKKSKQSTKKEAESDNPPPSDSADIQEDDTLEGPKVEYTEDGKEIHEVLEVSSEVVDEKLDDMAQAHRVPEKFWQKDVWRALLDPEMIKPDELGKFDLSVLLSDFTKEMLKEPMVDFRISGMAIYAASKLHHKKIVDVIDEEEKIQIKELRERAKREIPKAMPQPLREARKIATSDELYSAMRAAIIDTMQKRELLRRRRDDRVSRREELKVTRVKGQLPLEILKHITGKDKTIEQTMNEWLEKIKAKIKLNDKKKTSFFEICKDIIEIENTEAYAKKLKSVEFFIALLFLGTGQKIVITQDEDFTDITIELPKVLF